MRTTLFPVDHHVRQPRLVAGAVGDLDGHVGVAADAMLALVEDLLEGGRQDASSRGSQPCVCGPVTRSQSSCTMTKRQPFVSRVARNSSGMGFFSVIPSSWMCSGGKKPEAPLNVSAWWMASRPV